MTIRTTTRNAAAIARAIRQGEDFTTSGALKGVSDPYWIESGRMSVADSNAMRAAQNVGIEYVVYSYGTPIAYRTQDGNWTIPDAKYSVTTSMHQGVISYALGLV